MTPMLELRDLRTYYPVKSSSLARVRGHLKAVDGVSLSIRSGETLGLVGESGCGKSTLGRTIVGLEKATGGHVLFRGEDMSTASRRRLREIRREIPMVFQDPQASLDPRMKVVDIVTEGLRVGGADVRAAARRDRAAELLSVVGLRPEHLDRYPHEFSGGQRQRIGIARALAARPRLIIADEPVSSLDVSVQAQVLNLLKRLQRELKLSLLFISHDLNVVGYLADIVGVMYAGKMMETASVENIFKTPMHPYTKALLAANPTIASFTSYMPPSLKGEISLPVNPPRACRLEPRCPIRVEKCQALEPLLELKRSDHWAACHEVH
jgi:oligopeptide/dipeptide ABC transporter ATP-binding protein